MEYILCNFSSRFVLWPNTVYLFINLNYYLFEVVCALEKNEYSAALGFLYYTIDFHLIHFCPYCFFPSIFFRFPFLFFF